MTLQTQKIVNEIVGIVFHIYNRIEIENNQNKCTIGIEIHQTIQIKFGHI